MRHPLPTLLELQHIIRGENSAEMGDFLFRGLVTSISKDDFKQLIGQGIIYAAQKKKSHALEWLLQWSEKNNYSEWHLQTQQKDEVKKDGESKEVRPHYLMGVQKDIKDSDPSGVGYTALSWAVRNGDSQCEKLLLKYGAKSADHEHKSSGAHKPLEMPPASSLFNGIFKDLKQKSDVEVKTVSKDGNKEEVKQAGAGGGSRQDAVALETDATDYDKALDYLVKRFEKFMSDPDNYKEDENTVDYGKVVSAQLLGNNFYKSLGLDDKAFFYVLFSQLPELKGMFEKTTALIEHSVIEKSVLSQKPSKPSWIDFQKSDDYKAFQDKVRGKVHYKQDKDDPDSIRIKMLKAVEEYQATLRESVSTSCWQGFTIWRQETGMNRATMLIEELSNPLNMEEPRCVWDIISNVNETLGKEGKFGSSKVLRNKLQPHLDALQNLYDKMTVPVSFSKPFITNTR